MNHRIILCALLITTLSACTNHLADNLAEETETIHTPITLTAPVVSVEGVSSTFIVPRAANNTDIVPDVENNNRFTLELINADGTVIGTPASYIYVADLDGIASNGNDVPGWRLETAADSEDEAFTNAPITVSNGAGNYHARAWGTLFTRTESLGIYAGMVGTIAVAADGTFSLQFAPLTSRVQVQLKNATGGDPDEGTYRVMYTGIAIGRIDTKNKPAVGGAWQLTKGAKGIGPFVTSAESYTATLGFILPAEHAATAGTKGSTLFKIEKLIADGTTGPTYTVPFPSYTNEAGEKVYHSFTFKPGCSYTFTILLDGRQAPAPAQRMASSTCCTLTATRLSATTVE